MKNQSMNRRQMIQQATAAATAAVIAGKPTMSLAAPSSQRSKLGVVMYDCRLRRKWLQEQGSPLDLYEPSNFLEHCRSIGAGGAHVALGSLSDEEAGKLRDLAAEHGMFIDGILSPPENEDDLARFESEVKTAANVGVQAVRTVIIPGRRYERFQSFEAFQEFERRGRRMVEIATPIVEKHHVKLAIENHKDQRLADRLALYEHIDSEYVGACIDTGNSISLLDDAYGTIEALAPYAFSVHFKDQALAEYEDGFLLGDIPLGQGSLDLKRIQDIIRRQKPEVRFSLEVLTRDPLKVPCLTKDYWKTVADARGVDLANTLSFVRDNEGSGQKVSLLSIKEQVDLEDSNIAASLRFARESLNL